MKATSTKKTPNGRKIAIIAGAVLLGVVLLLGAGYWLVVPGIANSLVRDKLGAAEAKLGLNFKIDKVATHGVSAVSLVGFSVVDPKTDTAIFEAASISASIDALALLVGERKLSGVKMAGTTLYVHRNAQGVTNLETILARARGAGDVVADPPAAESSGADASAKLDAALGSFLRFFGDSWPDISVQNARVLLTSDEGAKPWEIDEISTDALTLEASGQSAHLASTLALKRGSGQPRWSLPETVTIDANLQRPLLASTGSIAFSTPLEVVGIGPYPFLRLGIGEVGVSEENSVTLAGLSLDIQGDSSATKLARIERLSASFNKLALSPKTLRPLDIQIEKPTLFLNFSAAGGHIFEELNQLLRAAHARRVVGVAKKMTHEIAVAQGRQPEEDAPTPGGLRGLLATIDLPKLLAKQAPQSLTIQDAAIQVTDARHLALLSADPKISLQNGNFELTHRVINGALEFKGGFDALANGSDSRGKATVDLAWNYRKNTLNLDAQIDALSIPWLVQLTSADLADNLRSGVLHADLKVEHGDDSSRLGFQGLVSLENLTFFLRPLAETPVEGLSASYHFEGFYDAKAPIPAPKLLSIAATNEEEAAADSLNVDLANAADTDSNAEDTKVKPPERGAFVISKGNFVINGIPGEFRPALFGLEGLKKRPTRFDAAVELASVPVNTLFLAIPDAIKGPLTGTTMRGDFAWSLALEVPLYRARDMKWNAKPVLSGFELISMPDAVDVRKLRDQFEMTIYDPTLDWSRKVTIPEMRPVPLDWLVEQSGMELEHFEKQSRIRQWPPRYKPGFVLAPDKSNLLAPHPAPWAAEEARAAAARRPAPTPNRFGTLFNFGASDTPEPMPQAPLEPVEKSAPMEKVYITLGDERKEHPYGPYEFVPLQYISPWMLRAAITTEDNSFFKHHGFNWLAIRNSVEANLEAGRYVRGASTISMQLIKNIFLTRDKVMVRKLREIFLVWIMEDIVDIPKARIMELYFNIIEYGPGVFGIHDAAMHYFGKRADKLSLSEVAWLVSIVPNPKKFHFYYERGEISDSWFRRMLRYVRVMTNRERATEADYEAAKRDKPRFYKPKDGEPLMRVEHTPEEVDELLFQTDTLEIPALQNLFGP